MITTGFAYPDDEDDFSERELWLIRFTTDLRLLRERTQLKVAFLRKYIKGLTEG